MNRPLCFFILILLGVSACNTKSGRVPPSDPSTLTSSTSTITSVPTVSPVPTQTLFPTIPLTSTATPTEPQGCRKPSNDESLLEVNGQTLNRRTLTMLEYAQTLYGGELEISGYAITQGSYTQALAESFGTHAGGGAVDLSVMRRGTYTILWDDIPPLIHALRLAGFAAWLRQPDELYDGSPIHIHAIAIGDPQLSPAAIEQLIGPGGYFLGFNGLPVKNGLPVPDSHGGPIICNWMRQAGYNY